MTDYDALLQQWVVEESKVVTYRYLSRRQDVHVAEAKRLLQAFYDANRSSVHATFALTGTLTPAPPPVSDDMDVDETPKLGENEGATSQGDGGADSQTLEPPSPVILEAILLVSEAKLEDALAKFLNPPRKHIYSLSAATPTGHPVNAVLPAPTPFQEVSIPLLYSVNKDILKDAELNEKWEKAGRGAKWGAIKNDSVVQLKATAFSHTSGAGAKVQSASSAARKSSSSKASEPTSTKSKSAESQASKRPFFGQTFQDKKATSAAPANKGTKRKGSDEDKEGSDEDDDAVEIKPKVKAKSKEERERQQKELEDMMDVDSDEAGGKEAWAVQGDDSDVEEIEAPKPKAKPTPKARASDTKAQSSSKSTKQETVESAATKVPKGDRKRVRKIRQVAKKERYKNEKGYTVSRTVDADESYSSWESDSDDDARAKTKQSAPKAAASASKADPEETQGTPEEAPKDAAHRTAPKPSVPSSSSTANASSSKKPAPQAKKEAPKKDRNQASLSSFFSKVDKKKK